SSTPEGSPPVPDPGATQPLGPPPGYKPGANLGYPGQGNLGYPLQPNLGYPVQPGMMPPFPGGAPFPTPSSASGPVPVLAVQEDEDAVLAAEAVGGEVFHPPALNYFEPPKRPNAIIEAWRKVGGGSLALSIAIHVGILVVGGAIVVSSQM